MEHMNDAPGSVLFVCSRNGGKSPIAEGIARAVAPGGTFASAGTAPGGSLNVESVAALAEIGVDISHHVPQPVTPELLAAADTVVVLGTDAEVDVPEGTRLERWILDEPSERGVHGAERMRLVRDEIARRVRTLLDGAAADDADAATGGHGHDDDHPEDTIEQLSTRAGRRRAAGPVRPTLRAVVTGASSGIGLATVELLRAGGWEVFALARRADRLEELAARTHAVAVVCDVTDEASVAAAVERVTADGPVHALVNVAGGALGVDSVAEADVERWQRMYDTNVLGTLRLTTALLPALRGSGRGDVVVVTSTAGHDTYPGGAGYAAAKHAERIIANTLRVELVGEPVRVIEIAPGMVRTEEFSLNRYDGDRSAADAVYQGVQEPLLAADVADAIVWTLTRPHHVNVDSMIIRPRAQASNTVVARQG